MKKKTNRIVAMLMALCLLIGLLPMGIFAATTATHMTTKPADGTTTKVNEPFDTSVSKNYRIPGLVYFKNQLIASADARWDNEKDGGGMDLVVSRLNLADANPSGWQYTFAGYLGDNGNAWDENSSTLMDPVIVTDGSTLYLFADMYPAGYSISESSTANTFSDTAIGFDSNGNLLLSKDGRSSYGYYLKSGKIFSTAGAEQPGYTVDGWYNLYQNGNYVTNLFFADSPFQVRATSYICMMTSIDGVTWSDPTLLNVKPEGVAWMVLGPGSGLVTQDGYTAFTAYDDTNIYLIYGKNGQWNTVRTNAAGNESSIIELNDGTIRAFVKRAGSNTIAYVDFTKTSSGYTAGSLVSTSDANFSNCMVSSLHYSKTLGGKEVILVCCPSDSTGGTWNGRFNGKVYMYTLDSNNAMTLVGTHQLNNSFFAYSNMAEMADGTIGLLYEDGCISYQGTSYGGASHITYTNVNLETVFGETFDEPKEVSVYVGETLELFEGKEGQIGTAGTQTTADGRLQLTIKHNESTTAGGTNYVQTQAAIGNGTFLIASGTNMLVSNGTSGVTNATRPTDNSNPGSTALWTITDVGDGYTISQVIGGTTYYLGYSSSSSGDAYFGGLTYTYTLSLGTAQTVWEYGNNGFYQRTLNTTTAGSWIGGSDTTNDYYLTATGSMVATQTAVTLYTVEEQNIPGESTYTTDVSVKGLAVGETKVELGGVTYTVNVLPYTYDVTLNADTRTATYPAVSASAGAVTITNPTVASASIADGKLVITALSEGKTTITDNYNVYNVTVTTSNESIVINSANAIERSATGNAVSNSNPAVASASVVNGKLVIKGLSEGETTITEGFNVYSVEVVASSVNLAILPGQSMTYEAIGTAVTNSNPAAATAKVIDGELIITGVAVGTTEIVDGFITYNVTVATTDKVEFVELYVGENKVITLTGAARNGSWESDAADVEWLGETVTNYLAQLGTNSSYGGEIIDLRECLYTFDKVASGIWIISHTFSDGTKVYVDAYNTNAKYPNRTNSTNVTITESGYTGATDGPFILGGTASNAKTGSLHFHTQSGTYYWNQCSSAHAENNTNGTHGIFIFKFTENGIEEVTSVNELTSGEQYLIAGKGGDGNFYAMHPTTAGETDVYAHLAKYIGPSAETGSSTEITIDAKAVGTTSVVIGDTTYHITVKYREKSLYLAIDETVTVTPAVAVTADDITAFNTANGAYVTAMLNDDGSVTFTGVASGKSLDVILGDTKYDFYVESLTAGDIAGFNTVIGTDSYTAANDTVDLNGKKIKALTLSVGTTFSALGVDIADPDSVTWMTDDASIATVDENGNVIAVGVGTTTITAIVVKDGVKETATVKVRVIPSLLPDGYTGTTDTSFTYIAQEANVDAYFSLYTDNGYAQEMVPVQEGEVIYFTRAVEDAYGIMWTSAPKEGYSLAHMAATGTVGQYYSLHAGDYIVKTDSTDYFAYANAGEGHPYYNLIALYGVDQTVLNNTITDAVVNNKCDGAMAMGRKVNTTTEPLVSSLSFAANKLATVDKQLNGVLPTTLKAVDFRRYTGEEMVASVGEYVYFTIDVIIDAPDAYTKNSDGTVTSSTVYSNTDLVYTLIDKLPGAYFYTKEQDADDDLNGDGVYYDGILAEASQASTMDIIAAMNANWTAAEMAAGKRVLEYYVVFEITDDYLNGDIVNDVDLTYVHSSRYSVGKYSANKTAKANIHVLGARLNDVVIDFGLPIQIVDEEGKFGFDEVNVDKTNSMRDMNNDGNADFLKYGSIQISTNDGGKYVLTYTPTSVLTAREPVFLYNEEGKSINYFFIYPATTVYYEEGFIDWDTDWTVEEKGTGNQTSAALGKDPNNYGFDSAYQSSYQEGKYTGTCATTAKGGAEGSFTFTGTGFDLYAQCTPRSGYLSVKVTDANGKIVKFYTIDTKVADGDSIKYDGAELNGMDLISLKGMDYGTYTVTVRKIMDSTKLVYIDGVRIYGTIREDITADANNSIYKTDLEDNPSFYELRDYVLQALGVNADTSVDYKTMIDQVYGLLNPGSSAVITGGSVDYTGITAQELLDNGPKNELFLYKNQTLTFKITTNRVGQIGLKAPNGATSYTIKVNNSVVGTENTPISSSVDMFYTLFGKANNSTDYTVTIKNTGSNILSVTDLKICDDPNFGFAPLTAQDIAMALRAMGYQDKTEPEATEPETSEPETSEPEETVPETTVPENTEPEVTEPEVTEPETTEPEATEPEATEPEATEPEATEPETTEPEATEPESTEPETTEPEATEPEATEPSDPTEETKPTETVKPSVPAEETKPTETVKPSVPAEDSTMEATQEQVPGQSSPETGNDFRFHEAVAMMLLALLGMMLTLAELKRRRNR